VSLPTAMLAALGVIAGGCAQSTLNEVRASPPTRTAVLTSTSYQTLATCVARRLELSTAVLAAEYRYLDLPGEQTATVSGANRAGTDVGWFFEARFQQREPGSVR